MDGSTTNVIADEFGYVATEPPAPLDVSELIDRALQHGLQSGDWSLCRDLLIALPPEAHAEEGHPFGLATAAFYVDQDAVAAERLVRVALCLPQSRWRPDSFRLLGVVLSARGCHAEARTTLEQGIHAVDALDIPADDKAAYKRWIEAAANELAIELAPEPASSFLAPAEGNEAIDSWLQNAMATGDWLGCRTRLSGRFGSAYAYEGFYLGLASACFYANRNVGRAESIARTALAQPESRWRPESYRLLGAILREAGKLEQAETALDAALDAIHKFALPDAEREDLENRIGVILLPVRVQLLEKDRSGIKSVLRNGIITGEHSDRRECREALIAIKHTERVWSPDVLSAILYASYLHASYLRRQITLRTLTHSSIRSGIVGARWLCRSAKLALLLVALATLAYLGLELLAYTCRNPAEASCAIGQNPLVRWFLGEYTLLWRDGAGWAATATEGTRRFLATSTAGQIAFGVAWQLMKILMLLAGLVAVFEAAKIFITMRTIRYTLNDARLTIRAGLLRRWRYNYEIMHASNFQIDQGIRQTLFGCARLSFYTVSVGGQKPEQVDVVGRAALILNLDKQIRGLARTLRAVARLKGIVAVD
jgi:hypothetical protein